MKSVAGTRETARQQTKRPHGLRRGRAVADSKWGVLVAVAASQPAKESWRDFCGRACIALMTQLIREALSPNIAGRLHNTYTGLTRTACSPLAVCSTSNLTRWPLGQGSESLSLYGRIVDKHIVSVFTGDETISLCVAEPFDGSDFLLTHFDYSLILRCTRFARIGKPMWLKTDRPSRLRMLDSFQVTIAPTPLPLPSAVYHAQHTGQDTDVIRWDFV